MLMFTRKTSLVWIGILFLSGMFLMGQDSWEPVATSITYDLVGSGSMAGTFGGVISEFTGTATLDLASGDLAYEYSDALVTVTGGAYVFVTSESGTISGTWDETAMVLSDTTGSGTIDTCENTTGDVCDQWLAEFPELTSYPIPSDLADGVVGSIDFSSSNPAFTVIYQDLKYDEVDVTINFTLTEQE